MAEYKLTYALGYPSKSLEQESVNYAGWAIYNATGGIERSNTTTLNDTGYTPHYLQDNKNFNGNAKSNYGITGAYKGDTKLHMTYLSFKNGEYNSPTNLQYTIGSLVDWPNVKVTNASLELTFGSAGSAGSREYALYYTNSSDSWSGVRIDSLYYKQPAYNNTQTAIITQENTSLIHDFLNQSHNLYVSGQYDKRRDTLFLYNSASLGSSTYSKGYAKIYRAILHINYETGGQTFSVDNISVSKKIGTTSTGKFNFNPANWEVSGGEISKATYQYPETAAEVPINLSSINEVPFKSGTNKIKFNFTSAIGENYSYTLEDNIVGVDSTFSVKSFDVTAENTTVSYNITLALIPPFEVPAGGYTSVATISCAGQQIMRDDITWQAGATERTFSGSFTNVSDIGTTDIFVNATISDDYGTIIKEEKLIPGARDVPLFHLSPNNRGIGIGTVHSDNSYPLEVGFKTKFINGIHIPQAQVTLLSTNWNNKNQTVLLASVTTNSSIIVAPAPSSIFAYGDNKIYCSGQGNGTLTFSCGGENAPTENITVNILLM